jgi:hypothetical protein
VELETNISPGVAAQLCEMLRSASGQIVAFRTPQALPKPLESGPRGAGHSRHSSCALWSLLTAGRASGSSRRRVQGHGGHE